MIYNFNQNSGFNERKTYKFVINSFVSITVKIICKMEGFK